MKKMANIENGKWKIGIVGVTIFYCLLSPCAVSAIAAFLDTPATARLAALGGSYVALADDAASITVNPAGLASIDRPEVTSDYSRLYMGLSDGSQISQTYLGGAMPLSFGGTVAAGWKEFHFDGLYKERTLSLGYGRWWTPQLAIGVSVKQLHHAYSAASQIVDDFGNIQSGTPDLFAENGTQKTAYSADMGALYKWSARTTLGVTVQDINQPNVALSSTDRDVVARTYRAGLASAVTPGLTLASSLLTRQALANQRDWIWTGGAELKNLKTTSGQWALRSSLTAGSRNNRQLAVGVGYGVGNLQLDYAFAMAVAGLTFGDTSGNHRFSLTYHFGSARQARLERLPQTDPAIPPMTQRPHSIEIKFIESL